MAKPVHIFIDRKELVGYTDLTLTRNKEKLTGEASFSVFMGWLPTEPVLVPATKGREVLIYIGGHLAFTGVIDRRRDAAAREGSGLSRADTKATSDRSLSVGPNEYSVRFTCRGKTKYIVDSSHQHATGTYLRPTNREVVTDLTAPWGTEIQWEADEIDLDKVRLRDGARVADELQRLSEMTSLYIYETRDGKLKVTDGSEATTGEPVVLGQNILTFSSDQAEDTERDEVTVKGQRIEKEQWGDPAVIPTLQKAKDDTVQNFSPTTVQLHGNGTDELLERRAQYEINKRATRSKQVTVEVFHVQQTDGLPWDLGVIHYVEIPPAGVFDLMEVIKVVYTVQANAELMTTITFAPAPVKVASGDSVTVGFLDGLPEINDVASAAASRRAKFGASFGAGHGWGSPAISFLEKASATVAAALKDTFLSEVDVDTAKPPMRLPASYKGEDT